VVVEGEGKMMDIEVVQTVLTLGAEYPDASAREIRDAVENALVERRVVGPATDPLIEFARAAMEILPLG
jgi:hypothetical protein